MLTIVWPAAVFVHHAEIFRGDADRPFMAEYC
jgi:hypothetical protein